jgi:hypothetical protein
MDMAAEVADIHMRTDANNLVSTAKTTHLPEQSETIHLITNLRKECQSGSIKDLAHVITTDMIADVLTKDNVKMDNLRLGVRTGILPRVDANPPFRQMLQNKHKAYLNLAVFAYKRLKHPEDICLFLGLDIRKEVKQVMRQGSDILYLDVTSSEEEQQIQGSRGRNPIFRK